MFTEQPECRSVCAFWRRMHSGDWVPSRDVCHGAKAGSGSLETEWGGWLKPLPILKLNSTKSDFWCQQMVSSKARWNLSVVHVHVEPGFSGLTDFSQMVFPRFIPTGLTSTLQVKVRPYETSYKRNDRCLSKDVVAELPHHCLSKRRFILLLQLLTQCCFM